MGILEDDDQNDQNEPQEPSLAEELKGEVEHQVIKEVILGKASDQENESNKN